MNAKLLLRCSVLAAFVGLAVIARGATAPNTLTSAEVAQGWRLLWDGGEPTEWRGPHADSFPSQDWKIKDGALELEDTGGEEGGRAGDIITSERFSNFELSLEFKITPGANSGIKYFVQPDLNREGNPTVKTGKGSAIGLEYQILDDALHPDAKRGKNGNRTLASLYDLYSAAKSKKPKPVGEWNTARIVSQGDHVEHWLNGKKVVEYTRFTDKFRKDVQESKYKVWPNFGEWKDGHIMLQNHGKSVAYRNIKIRVLDDRPAKSQ